MTDLYATRLISFIEGGGITDPRQRYIFIDETRIISLSHITPLKSEDRSYIAAYFVSTAEYDTMRTPKDVQNFLTDAINANVKAFDVDTKAGKKPVRNPVWIIYFDGEKHNIVPSFTEGVPDRRDLLDEYLREKVFIFFPIGVDGVAVFQTREWEVSYAIMDKFKELYDAEMKSLEARPGEAPAGAAVFLAATTEDEYEEPEPAIVTSTPAAAPTTAAEVAAEKAAAVKEAIGDAEILNIGKMPAEMARRLVALAREGKWDEFPKDIIVIRGCELTETE